MTPTAPPSPPYAQPACHFSKENFDALADFAMRHFGLNMPDSKMPMLYTRLWRRLRVRGLDDFSAYCRLIENPSEAKERQALLSALTTNVTRFFREPHHFDTLKSTVLPPLIEAAKKGRRVRLWSAGCSTGQEAFSIAMCLLDLCPDAHDLDIKILGTDIDPVVIEHARVAQYTREDLAPIPAHLAEDHVRYDAKDAPSGEIGARARQLVSFGVLNLINPLPFSGPFQVIFCRNVTIYFDKPTQAKVWATFNEVLTSGSYLFVGHSERVTGAVCHGLRSVGTTTYIKS